MLLYLFIILIMVILTITKLEGIDKEKKFIFGMFVLWFMATVRSIYIGNDTIAYYEIWDDISSNHNYSALIGRFERGYLWLNNIIGYFTQNFHVFLGIVNFIIYYSYYRFIKTYSNNSMLSLIIFFLLGTWGQTLNTIRLQLAVSMFLNAYYYKNHNKKIRVAICVLLAILFQRISVVYITGLFLPKKVKGKIYIFIASIGALFFIFLPQIILMVVQIVPYFSTYLNSDIYILGEVKMAVVLQLLMELMVFLCAFKIYKYKYHCKRFTKEVKENFAIQINMIFVSIMVMFLSLRFNLLDRCSYFFWDFVILLLPNMVWALSLKSNKTILKGAIIAGCVAYFAVINIFRPNWNHIYPYMTFFSDL